MPPLSPAALRKQIASGETAPLYALIGEDDLEKSAVAGEFADMVDEGLRAGSDARRRHVLLLRGRLRRRMKTIILWAFIGSLALSSAAFAQGSQNLPESENVPSSLMTFFVTSEPVGDGGNLGGLAGADAHCQALATAVGEGDKTWRAYLSTQARPGQSAVNARDRIGEGPWSHSKARLLDYLDRRLNRPIVKSQIHGDTLEEAQRGSNLTKEFALTEKGDIVNGIGDPLPTRHDILTGSQPDGRAFTDEADRTCDNWTSNGEGSAQVGHSDRVGNGNQSWNSSHATTGCSQEDFIAWGGVGLFYCFAVD